METKTTANKRSFDLHLSEEEATILCAMMDRSDDAICSHLEYEFMDGETTLNESVRIALEMRNKIHKMVWGE